MKVGMIGLGAMGNPIASNLVRAELLDIVWNRDSDKSIAFAKKHDVEVAECVPDLALQCDLIFVCVSNGVDLLEVVDHISPGLDEMTVVVDLSTTSVEMARKASELITTKGAQFLDAPVSGGVEGAQSASLVMMIGGDEQVLERVIPVLETISRKQLYMGAVGSGQATKAVNQIMVAGINQAVAESMAFAEALGMDMPKVIEAVTSGSATSWFIKNRGASLVAGNYEKGFKVLLHDKDLAICQQMAQNLTLGDKRLPLVEMTRIHYKKLIASGYGDKDISCLYTLKKELFDPARKN